MFFSILLFLIKIWLYQFYSLTLLRQILNLKVMKKIECYKTNDGIVFENQADAKEHEEMIIREKATRVFVESTDFIRGNSDDLIDFIIENRNSLLEILK